MLQYIQDRDLWKFELPHSREVSRYMQSFDMNFLNWTDVAQTFETDFDSIRVAACTMETLATSQVNRIADAAVWGEIDGYCVPIVNTSLLFSEVGEELCKRFPKEPFAAYYFDRADCKRQWGLRSRNGFDVSTVAKVYGGGGHPAAAGFITDRFRMPLGIQL